MNQKYVLVTRSISILLLFLIGYFVPVSAQLLCEKPAGSEVGAFEIDGNITAGCSPLTINLKNKSTGTDIRYDIYYDGKPANKLDMTGNKDSTNLALFANPNSIRVYTILQYGIKSGKPMYYCQSISVLPQPKVTYTTCNNIVNIDIPKQSLINNSKIEYKLGTNPPISFSETLLPKPKSPTNVAFPVILNYYYINNLGQKSCINTVTITQPVPVSGIINNPHWAQIKKLEMIESSKASIQFTGSESTEGYSVYMNKKNATFNNQEVLKNAKPGTFNIDLPDSTNSYCFFVSREEECGGTERSADICTIPLDTIAYLPKDNILNWDAHPLYFFNSIVPLPPIFGYRNLISELKIEEKGGSSTLVTLINTQETYTDNIDCKKDYCYQLSANSDGVLFYHPFQGISKSLERCISRNTIKTPPITDVFVTVNDNQKNEIAFTDNSNWILNKDQFYLFKEINNSYKLIDSSSTKIAFIDNNSTMNINPECYKVGYKDECGSKSIPSPEICNILLTYGNDDNINWTLENPFGTDNVSNFEIISFDENTNVQSTFNSVSSMIANQKVDLSTFETEAKFKIKAIGQNGNISYSNITTIPIEALFFVPTAFTPNNDNENDSLSVKGRFGRVQYMEFAIFNRWGEKIYQTKDKHDSWDGKTKGKPAPVGLYFYVFNVTLTNKEQKIIKGQFLLIN